VVPLDFGQGTGSALEVNYRDGVLITTERPIASSYAQPYVYVETVPGEFEHVAILHTWYDTIDHDVSGRTVVAIDTVANSQRVNVFVLPEPLMAAAAVPNDFEDGDASDFTNASGQFALATRGNNEVLTPTTTTGLNIAVVQDSDWNYYQRIEAGIAPSFAATDGWVGLVARYVDADNYYYLAVHNDNTTRLYRRLEGVDTLLAESRFDGPMASRIALYVDDGIVNAWVDEQFTLSAADRSLPHGRAGLATFRAGADFDDVHVAAAGRRTLLVKEYLPQESPTRFDLARPFSRISGDWQYRFDVNGWINGFQQRDPSRSAFAFVGGQVRNQEIEAVVQINAVSDATAAWVGVLGRYVDARTHYYATLRKTNRVEIRKQVNGVVTVLAAANFALEDGRFYTMNFRIVEDQLQLFIDDVQMLSARDDEISEGQHGLATHRAAATWNWVVVRQP
jgi:hypothetical protein